MASFGLRLVAAGVVLTVLLFVLAAVFDEHVVTCKNSPYVRHLNPDATGGAWMPLDTRETLAFTMVRVALSLLVLTTAAVAPPERRRYVFITCVVCALAYLPGIAVVNYFKYSVADYECHYHDTSRANAVSGHAFYYAWVLASFQYCAHLLDHVMAAPADGEGASPAFISWLLLVFSLLCLAPQAFFTYYYGYHSLQQILLGAIFVRPRARRA